MKSFFFFHNMQIFKFLFSKPQFYCRTDISEICHLNPILWSSYLICCMFHKGLPLSYHRKSICWNILPYCLISTLLPSDKGYVVASLSSDYWNFFLFSLILLFYLLIIFNGKVKSSFLGLNYFLFDRIRR